MGVGIASTSNPEATSSANTYEPRIEKLNIWASITKLNDNISA
jgi:hypothetical protein